MIKSLKERSKNRFDDRILTRVGEDEITSDLLVALSLFSKIESSNLSNLEKSYPGVVSAHSVGAQMNASRGLIQKLVHTHFSGMEAEMVQDILSRVPYDNRIHIIVDPTKHSLICKKYTCARYPVCSVVSYGEECFNPYVLPYDGYIESASELARLLEFTSQSQLHVFCGGVSQEALGELKKRKNLWIHTVSTDVAHIATIGDIATSCSAPLRNYHTGELLITIDPSTLTAVESIRTTSNTVEIESSAGLISSQSLIEDLMMRRASSTEDGVHFIDERLQRLSSKRFEITTSSSRLASKLSQLVREMSACIASGCCETEDSVYPYISALAKEKNICSGVALSDIIST